MPSYTKLHNYAVGKLFKRTFKRNIAKHCRNPIGRALVYHKTDSLSPGYIHDYSHTNLWEIACLVKSLNRLGFIVDAVDRSIPPSFLPENIYDLFIGIGTDDSGRHFSRFAKHLSRAVTILYAASSSPNLRNENIKKRYHQFEARNHHRLSPRRLVQHINFPDNINSTDYIFCVGNNYTTNTFRPHNKPIYKLWLSSAPHLSIDQAAIHNKQPDKWMFFAGSGNILKGLDLVIEAFVLLPQLSIHICTRLEPDFLSYYRPLLNKSNNIHIEGFVDVKSKRFQKLTSRCGFVILPSCTEGTATSVTACMRRGLIPVVTKETGVDVDSFGFIIKSLSVPQLASQIADLSGQTSEEFRQRIIASHLASWQYTQQSYEHSLFKALLHILTHNPKLTGLT